MIENRVSYKYAKDVLDGNLSSCLKGKFKTIGGYRWRYE